MKAPLPGSGKAEVLRALRGACGLTLPQLLAVTRNCPRESVRSALCRLRDEGAVLMARGNGVSVWYLPGQHVHVQVSIGPSMATALGIVNAADQGVTLGEVCEAMGLSRKTVHTALTRLMTLWKVVKAGRLRGTIWHRPGLCLPASRLRLPREVKQAAPANEATVWFGADYPKQSIVPAVGAAPVKTNAVRSVFELGLRP